ncbi:MAG TPA: glycosyltransferase [Fimbriimonadaceae bacterium]|nr:glycosyltransferase [Fimbriimonadaceae bacterium]
MKKESQNPNPEMALLYIGAFTPDSPEYRNPGSSTAGNMFQLNFLTALAQSDLPNPTVYSYFPVASFPRVKQLFFGSTTVRLGNGLRATSLPHLNLGAFKILTLGISAAWRTFLWGLKNRHVERRVVICYNLTAPPAMPLALVCRWMDMDLVPFIGDIYVPGEVVKDTWLRRLEFASQKMVIPKARGLLIANQAIIDDFAPDRHALLMEGGVMDDFLRRFERKPKLPDGKFHVVFAGQLSVLNGVTMLLDALKLLDMPNLRVSIVGGGEYVDTVRKAVAKDVRLAYLGLVPHREVMELYETADLLVNLRRTDYQTHRYVFPSKVVECLATGRPLLSTCTGHVEEEFGEFVFKLEEETPEALAKAIRDIARMDPEARAERGRKAQEYVRENKTWEGHARRLKAYLDDHVFAEEMAA